MKPFDLEKALAGAKCVTRDGREVTEIHYFKTDTSNRPICAIIDGSADWYTLDGLHIDDKDYDLFLAPTKKTYWVNVYRYPDYDLLQTAKFMYETKAESIKRISDEDNYIGTFAIEIEE